MKDCKSSIDRAYSAFNARNVDGALALMTHDASWPTASEGGAVVGKVEICDHWTRVEPRAMTEEGHGKVRVTVHQVVKNPAGDVLSDSEVVHVFTLRGSLISAKILGADADPAAVRPLCSFISHERFVGGQVKQGDASVFDTSAMRGYYVPR